MNLDLALGLGSRRAYRAPTPAPSPAAVAPSVSWDGTAGSVALPADWTEANYTRTTAKPALRPVLDNGMLCFDDNDLITGVQAFCSGGGSVEAFVEGNTYPLTLQKVSRTDANGNPSDVWMYPVLLDHSAVPTTAASRPKFNVYYRMIPADGTMQRRIIGPFTYTVRPAGQLYDYDLTVGPTQTPVAGSVYTSIGAAMIYLRTQVARNARITLVENADYNMSTYSGSDYNGLDGNLTIRAATGVTAYIRPAAAGAFSSSRSFFPLPFGGVRFVGSNIIIDLDTFTTLRASPNLPSATGNNAGSLKPVFFDGVRFTQATSGRLGKGAPRRFNSPTVAAGAAGDTFVFRDCEFSECFEAAWTSTTALIVAVFTNNRIHNIVQDVHKGLHNIYGSTVYDVLNNDYETGYTAFKVTYSGANAFFRLARSGNNLLLQSGASAGTVATDATIALGDNSGTYRTFAQVVADINTFGSGYSASVDNEVWDAYYTCLFAAPTTPDITSPSAAQAKGTTIQAYQRIDIHADMNQPTSGAITFENAIFCNVKGYGLEQVQEMFLSSATVYNDVAFVNWGCASQSGNDLGGLAQIGVPMSHVMFWNCVFDQNVQFNSGSGSDTYTSIKSCIFGNSSIAFSVSAPSGGRSHQWTIDGCHFSSGSAPAGATNSSMGTALTTLLTDPAHGDFSPKAGTGPTVRTSMVAFDLNNQARGAASAIGAVG